MTHQVTENVRGLPSEIHDSGGGDNAEDLTYAYDADGNPRTILDYATGARNTSMGYDGLNRLTSAWIAGVDGGLKATYSYDALGQITQVAQGSRQRTYIYGNYYSGRLYEVDDNEAGSTTFDYDYQGNLAQRNGVVYDFDYGNRLRSVSGEEHGYVYDAYGRRVGQTDSTGTIDSFYDHTGKLIYQRDRAGGTHDYLYLGGKLVAIRNYDTGGIARGWYYQHSDALGSIIRQTDNNAQDVPNTAAVYDAWGGMHRATPRDAPGYTGHMQDADTGLVYMQQRYYDPEVGRFLSMDPVQASGSTGANLDRYWYASDSPYRYTDPFGMCTGSHISNSDGTCASSGDFTTQASNAHLPGASASQRASILGFQPTNAQSSALSHLSYQDVAGQDSTRETKFIMDDSGKITENSQEGCYSGSECRFSPSEASKGSLYGHTHVYPSISRMNPQAKILLMTRDEPGPGDANPLSIGKVSAIFTPGGYKYLIEGTVHSPHLIYLGGGNPAFGNFVQDTWAPGMTLEKMEEVIEQQYHH